MDVPSVQAARLPAPIAAYSGPAGSSTIEHHHHGPEFHIYGADGQEAAAQLIRKALTERKRP